MRGYLLFVDFDDYQRQMWLVLMLVRPGKPSVSGSKAINWGSNIIWPICYNYADQVCLVLLHTFRLYGAKGPA